MSPIERSAGGGGGGGLAFSGCRLTLSVNQSIPNNAETIVTWDTETWDTDNYHSTAANTGRLTAPATGTYGLWVVANFAANATGQRYCGLRLNGGADTVYLFVGNAATGGLGTIGAGYFQIQLTVGDYVEMFAYQVSGAALNLTGGAAGGSFYGIQRVA